MYFIKNSKGEWWELDKVKLMVLNFNRGGHAITNEEIEDSEIFVCDSWHTLYEIKNYCPLEVNVRWRDVWVSPDGLFYNGDAHENRAEEILEIIYGETDVFYPGDRLEELGWIRASTSLMWEVRLESDYWKDKVITQKTYNALWNWCKYHNKKFPCFVNIKEEPHV